MEMNKLVPLPINPPLWKKKSQINTQNHEILSTVISPLPLIQEGQLSITGENMFTSAG